jgi:predicted metal-dependent phosphotriesterase family hydrolase
MNWLEALKAMREGKRVKRSSDVLGGYITCDKWGFREHLYNESYHRSHEWKPFISDYEATDWEIVELTEEQQFAEKVVDIVRATVGEEVGRQLRQLKEVAEALKARP